MKITKDYRRFTIGGIPVVGNIENGALIGLTEEGVKLLEEIEAGKKINEQNLLGDMKELYEELINSELIGEKENKKDEKVLSAYFHVTDKCNLRCLGCYSLVDERNKKCDGSLVNYKKYLEEIRSLGVQQIIVSGGEPLLRKDLSEILKYAKEVVGIEHISMITNGVIVTEENIKKIKPYIDEISVSVDGYSKENPTFIRDEGIFDKIVKGINIIKDMGISVAILPTVHKLNTYKLQEYVNWSKNLGVGISFSLLSCDTEVEVFQDHLLKKEELHHLAGFFDGSNGEIIVNDSPLDYSLNIGKSCGVGKKIISVGADGKVYPCHMLHEDKFIIADLNKVDSLKEAIKDSRVWKQCGELDVDKVEGCKSCEHKYLCSGGCRARSYFSSKNLESIDNYCLMNKLYYDTFAKAIVNQYK